MSLHCHPRFTTLNFTTPPCFTNAFNDVPAPASGAHMAQQQMVLAIRSRLLPASRPAPVQAGGNIDIVPPDTGAEPAKKAKKKRKKKKKKPAASPVVNGGGGRVGRFTEAYGANFAGLEPWVRLCRDLGVEGPLGSKTQCKKALENIHVNIHDFLDAVAARKANANAAAERAAARGDDDQAARAAVLAKKVKVQRFQSEWTLSAYTINNGLIYSRKEIRANQEHPLKLLMKHILGPKGGKARRGAVGG